MFGAHPTKYHKIQNIYLRDPATKHKTLLEGQYAHPEFEYLSGLTWDWTEKVDGTNVRVILSAMRESVTFGGRTDNAQMPTFLLAHLRATFTLDRMHTVFDPEDIRPDSMPVVLYGEGYGARIQKGGGDYIPDGCGFILFDVRVGHIWLQRGDVEGVADRLEIPVVPIVGQGTLPEAVEYARKTFYSEVAQVDKQAEGLVVRPAVGLQTRTGRRIIAKIKSKDFPTT